MILRRALKFYLVHVRVSISRQLSAASYLPPAELAICRPSAGGVKTRRTSSPGLANQGWRSRTPRRSRLSSYAPGPGLTSQGWGRCKTPQSQLVSHTLPELYQDPGPRGSVGALPYRGEGLLPPLGRRIPGYGWGSRYCLRGESSAVVLRRYRDSLRRRPRLYLGGLGQVGFTSSDSQWTGSIGHRC